MLLQLNSTRCVVTVQVIDQMDKVSALKSLKKAIKVCYIQFFYFHDHTSRDLLLFVPISKSLQSLAPIQSSTSFSKRLLDLPLFFWHPLFLLVLISPVFDVFCVCPKYVNFCFLMKFVIITLYIQCILLRIDKHNYICDFDYV